MLHCSEGGVRALCLNAWMAEVCALCAWLVALQSLTAMSVGSGCA